MAQLAIPQFKADHPDLIEQSLIDDALKMCESMDDITYIYRLNKELGLADVLCHGDVHAQNMIFMKDQPNKLLGLLDWQVFCELLNSREYCHSEILSDFPSWQHW